MSFAGDYTKMSNTGCPVLTLEVGFAGSRVERIELRQPAIDLDPDQVLDSQRTIPRSRTVRVQRTGKADFGRDGASLQNLPPGDVVEHRETVAPEWVWRVGCGRYSTFPRHA